MFVLASSQGTWRRQCKIAELSVEGSAIAGHSAAALHGIPGFREGPIELWTPLTAKFRNPVAKIHRYAGAKLTIVEGFQVTTVAQTLVDEAMVLGPWSLERAIDASMLARKVSIGELDERLTFYEAAGDLAYRSSGR